MRRYCLIVLVALACVYAQDTSDIISTDAGIGVPSSDGIEQLLDIASTAKACSSEAANANVTCDNTTATEVVASSAATQPIQVRPDAGSSRDEPNTVEIPTDRMTQLEKELAAAKAELANAKLQLDDSIQMAKSLEDKIERMHSNHVKELNETFNELESISIESEKYQRQFEQNEERLKSTRKQLSQAEQELRDMHYNAVNQYVNFTLIGSDLMEFAQDVVSTTSRRFNLKRRSHQMKPKINRAKHRTKTKYGNTKKNLKMKATQMQRRLNRHWTKSTYVRPLIEEAWGKVAKYTFDVYHPYQPIVNDIKTALHLSSLSAIEVTSKGVLIYLDNHIKRKEDRETKRRERDKEMANRHGRHHRPPPRKIPNDVKISANGKVTVEPSYLHKKIRPLFQFMLDNKEILVSEGASVLPLFVVLYFIDCLPIGIVLYFIIGLPHELIWAFAAIKLARTIRTKWAGKTH